jgi:outer membrane protein OmpA-like peptidoglycan-associated protein
MRIIATLCAGTLIGCGAAAPRRPMQLQRIVLYQNGIGHFERSGHVSGETLRLSFSRGELDDVLKTLTVIDRLGTGVATVDIPSLDDKATSINLGVRMSSGRVHDVQVSYAVPTPMWKAAYRVVMDRSALLQGWAMINNASQEDWRGVHLTLATGAPMSFVHDLHTPQYAHRPSSPVEGEKAYATDADSDGIPDAVDACPDSREDRDSFEDDDGCPDADNDHDRISDRNDRCPNVPETYNGLEDTDGCPDRGRVVVTDTSVEVLDLVYFKKSSDTIQPVSQPIVDAIGATLQGNPDIVKLEISGHASSDEAEPWGLSSRRAAAVRTALVARGVDPRRLAIVPYGATRPVSPDSAEKNRRVDFLIAQRREAPQRESHLDATTMQRSVHTATEPAEVAGTVRYELTEPVSIRKGTSSMVSILNKTVSATDVYLFRPDPDAAGSERHPFRAVRLVNDSGFMLEPGPVAIFARGSFVGDSMLQRLAVGETAWIPYALDGAAQVTVSRDGAERPVRIVAIARGVLTVETADVRTTTYTITTGREPCTRLYIRHDKLDGYMTKDLPPGTQDRGDSFLIPLPLQPGKTSTLSVEERQPRRHSVQLLDAGATDLALYIEGSKLPPATVERLNAAIAQRKEMGAYEDRIEAARTRLLDLAARADDLRENIKALANVRGSDDVRKKLVGSLASTTADADAQAKQLGLDSEALASARSRLQDSLRELTLVE